jgi:hypothetical protein
MKRTRKMLAVLLFLAASTMARDITVAMWDYYRGSWDGASLRISVNGVLSNASKESGLDWAYFNFNAGIGDDVIFYWHKGNVESDDAECAFAAYYTDEPPSKPFNPQQNNNDVGALLIYRLHGALATVSEGEALGSFKVVPPKPVVTVSPQSVSLSAGGTHRFSAAVKNLNAPDSSVTWSVSGNLHSGTVIGADGVLTLSPDETATALTVKAACNADGAIYGTAAVSVYLPYRIGTAAELKAFADSINSGRDFRGRFVLLTADIDLSGYGAQFNDGKGWIPIGKTNTNSRFRGSFDGGGHCIRNLYINDANLDYAGLFGYVDTAGSVTNLELYGVNITGRLRVGGIAGYVSGGITSCGVAGLVSGNQFVGGMAGQLNGGSLTNCCVAGSVSGSQYVGGIAGQLIGSGGINRCYSTAEVGGSGYVGGIAGGAEGSISYCAALNPSVKGNNSAGRVTGSAQTAALSGNIAFSNMLNRAENRNWNNTGLAAIDGENISPGDIRAGGTLGGRFADGPWIAENGKLPGLFGSAADMPDHIAEFYVLRYVVPAKYAASTTGDTVQTIRDGADGRAVTVTEKYGYTFVRWSDGSTDNPRQDTDVRSDIAVIAYFQDENGNVSVKTPDRVIPTALPDEEATLIAPVTILSGEFTAGPNPVLKQSGSVNFYRQGRRVSNSELRIYDAAGNVINKIKIRDNAIGNQARRQVGAWNLCDRNGRIVSEGAYLVKGVLKTSDGKSEKVSVILGVR